MQANGKSQRLMTTEKQNIHFILNSFPYELKNAVKPVLLKIKESVESNRYPFRYLDIPIMCWFVLLETFQPRFLNC